MCIITAKAAWALNRVAIGDIRPGEYGHIGDTIQSELLRTGAVREMQTSGGLDYELTEAGETVDLKFRPEERRENPGSRAGNMIFYS